VRALGRPREGCPNAVFSCFLSRFSWFSQFSWLSWKPLRPPLDRRASGMSVRIPSRGGTAETPLRIGSQPSLRDSGGQWTAACPTVETVGYCQASLAGLCSQALPLGKAPPRIAEPQSAQWSVVGMEHTSPRHPANRCVAPWLASCFAQLFRAKCLTDRL
jgi:hypothetical protein